MTDQSHSAALPPEEIERMFDRIARRYDLLNRLLSFRQDVRWRKRMMQHLPPGEDLRLLDLATGTADVMLFLARVAPRIVSATGLDPAAQMLAIGHRKIRDQGLDKRLTMMRGDATRIGLQDESFDVVSISFGIRNVPDVPAALREMRRVLRPGGRALILEFSLPANPIIRAGYLFYFRHILPRLGTLISGDADAYRYLNRSAEAFPHGQAFCQKITEAGFRQVIAYPLTFGIATLYLPDT